MRVLEGKSEFPYFWLLVLVVCLWFTAWNFAQGDENPRPSDSPQSTTTGKVKTVTRVGQAFLPAGTPLRVAS